MRRSLLLAVLLPLAALLAGPAIALADEPGIGHVFVPADHVVPGETFPVTGYDLDPGASLLVGLSTGSTSIALGTRAVAADGTLSTTVLLPPTFPTGYAELTATSAEGGRWSTFVLVGERAEGPKPSGAASDATLNSQTIALIVMLVGLVIFAGAGLRYLRR